LENLSDSKDKNWAWEKFKEIIKAYIKESQDMYEMNQHKSWFHEECLGYLDQRKQAKMQWVLDPSQDSEQYKMLKWQHFRSK